MRGLRAPSPGTLRAAQAERSHAECSAAWNLKCLETQATRSHSPPTLLPRSVHIHRVLHGDLGAPLGCPVVTWYAADPGLAVVCACGAVAHALACDRCRV